MDFRNQSFHISLILQVIRANWSNSQEETENFENGNEFRISFCTAFFPPF